MGPFVHLHVHSQYSILDASASLSGIVEKNKLLGMPAVYKGPGYAIHSICGVGLRCA